MRCTPSDMNGLEVVVGMDWYTRDRSDTLRRRKIQWYKEIGANVKSIQDTPIERNHTEVFSEDLYGLPPTRQVDFQIDLVLGATPVAKAPLMRFLALKWLLEEIHVTLAHLEKKQTRLRTYTKLLKIYAYSGWRRRHRETRACKKDIIEEVEETRGISMEVEPLDHMKLEDLGLNTSTRDLFLSSRGFPSVDEPEPQPLPNLPFLDINLGDKRGTDLPIKPYSPGSFKRKVVKPLTIHTPPSPHVAYLHRNGFRKPAFVCIAVDMSRETRVCKKDIIDRKMTIGIMEVNLVDAHGLTNSDFLNNIDPYVVIKYRSQEHKSTIAKAH
nr:hypothetical protein [Tanacetum cinerariifolium]